MHKPYCFVYIKVEKETLKIVNSEKIRGIYYDSRKDGQGFIRCFIRSVISFRKTAKFR